MKFVDDAKARLKHFSTIALGLGASLQGAWLAFPEEFKTSLGADVRDWFAKLTGLVLLWGLVGKFVAQPPKE